jgi:hypothetical protein
LQDLRFRYLSAKLRKIFESNTLLDKKVKKVGNLFVFSEFCHDSSNKNELFLISLLSQVKILRWQGLRENGRLLRDKARLLKNKAWLSRRALVRLNIEGISLTFRRAFVAILRY